jgi:hypothetical protein
MRRIKNFFLRGSPIIQGLGQFLVGDPGVLDGIGRIGVAELSLNRCDIAGLLYEVPAHGVAGVMGVWPPTPAKLQTSFHTVLITRGLSRPSPWALVAGERNRAGDLYIFTARYARDAKDAE